MTLWALASTAHAWTAEGPLWGEPPIPYWIAADVGPYDEAATLAAIHAAFATWSSPACTSVRFLYQGRVEAPLMATDGLTVVTVVGQGWPQPDLSPAYTQLTAPEARILEADVALDAEGVAWSLGDDADGNSVLDLQAGLVTQVGHLLGIGDSEVLEASMNPALLGAPDARTLSDDDVAAVCSLYPTTAPGAGELGDPCVNDDSCAEGHECVLEVGRSYCSPTCTTEAQCPAGYTCLRFVDHRVCAVGGCGCSAEGVSGGAWLVAALAAWRRRSRRALRSRRSG
ncbi:MAG: matrixin family metalloprotease [Myxococcota bacterium]